MRIGCVVDNVQASEESANGGADFLVLCQGLLLPGSGSTPSLGFVEAVSVRTQKPLYVLVRPVVGCFELDPFDKAAALRDVAHFAAVPGVQGLVVAAQTPERTPDIETLREFVEASGGKEVWYHRSYMCLVNEFEAFETLGKAGLTGVIVSLHGEVVDEKVEYAAERLAALERSGLAGMICGSIPAIYRDQVVSKLNLFTAKGTLKGWVVPVPMENSFEGALLPWRDWDISSYLWPDTKTVRLPANRIQQLVASYVALFKFVDSAYNSTIAPI
eukprot:Protomagalhaensia_sp_Gyna_25__2604@NODE_2482_length_1062_cov_20_535679_g2055_i0_p1_GENE_NODE_2482_length_1062_cov_20_535679_g2055_i0NODE_2482_length_1062_cov_20_535679_g2055_i0_p1_ORF_typecomplete_len273_score68_48CutC/PF03932_14/1_1e21_NODE_2482_length_1062_cov_20_535679_g2055_i025843